MKYLRWGILGTGRIAQRFAQGLANTDQASIVAVASRSLDKAREFAAKYNAARAYGSYDELLSDGGVDIVYITLPNHLHADWSIRCADAGKHILCEKPVTVNASELERVLAAVRKRDVFFMEAFMYRCHPQIQKILEIIRQGRIGNVCVVQTGYGFNMGAGSDDIRMKNSFAGGGLMDVGCYCVSLCRLIAGEEPVETHAVAKLGENTRVDEYMTGILKFPTGMTACFACGMQCDLAMQTVIYGNKGNIRVTSPWYPIANTDSLTISSDAGTESINVWDGRDIYLAEALAIAEHIDKRQAPMPLMSWADSLGQMRTLDSLRKSMGLKFDCED